MFHDPGQILELKQFPMFENYKEEELEKLLYRCYHFTYNPGDAIKHKGYHTDFFIFLTEGTIETITTVKNGQKVLREQFHSPKLVAPTIPFASDDTATTISPHLLKSKFGNFIETHSFIMFAHIIPKPFVYSFRKCPTAPNS